VLLLPETVEILCAEPLLAAQELDNVWHVKLALDDVSIGIARVKKVLEPGLLRLRRRDWVPDIVWARREFGLELLSRVLGQVLCPRERLKGLAQVPSRLPLRHVDPRPSLVIVLRVIALLEPGLLEGEVIFHAVRRSHREALFAFFELPGVVENDFAILLPHIREEDDAHSPDPQKERCAVPTDLSP
jgi:hypothetical protein